MAPSLPVGTKCSVPRLPDTFVRRGRLDRDAGSATPPQVTLVSAPPGAGKSTLVAGWADAWSPAPVAWLTVDGRDNDPRRLATLCVTALERGGGLDGFVAPQGPADVVLDALFDHLMERDEHRTLVLDDLQEISSRSGLHLLAHLVLRAPPVLDLILATRADPPISWGRLRLDGRLRQIRHADLRFRPDEAAELLAAHGVRLSRDDTRLLCERTEGWAAGLRLAAGTLRAGTDPDRFVLSTSATQMVVSDYLVTEVLGREEPAVQQLLLRTSVADRVTPELATALTGDRRAGEHLADLARRGLFVVELDEGGAYRYHALFGALLRARLRLQDAGLLAELHRRAARWHLAAEMTAEAEAHGRAAGDWALVGRLVLARWLDATLDGRDLSGSSPLVGLAPAIVGRVPELALVAAAEACRAGNRADADLHRPRPGPASGRTPGADDADTGDATMWTVATAVLDLAYGRAFGDDGRSDAAATALEGRATVDRWTARARDLAMLRRVEMQLGHGDLGGARHRLQGIVARARPPWLDAEATALLALIEAAAGDLAAADAGAVRVLDVHVDAGDAIRVAHLATAVGAALRGEPRSSLRALAAAEARPPVAWHTLRSVERVVAAAVRGRLPVAPRVGPDVLRTPLVQQVLVALGVFDVVDESGRHVAVGGDGERAVYEARQWVGARESAPVVDAGGGTGMDGGGSRGVGGWLDGASARGRRHAVADHPRTLIEARVLAAVLADRPGEAARVTRHLAAAIELVTATGIRAPFDTYAPLVGPLLDRRLVGLGAQAAHAMELVDRLAGSPGAAPVELLTEREREVLHHLPTLMSNVEIAAGMYLSVNTVKSHLKAIYRKLGVESRRQAVMRARELELL